MSALVVTVETAVNRVQNQNREGVLGGRVQMFRQHGFAGSDAGNFHLYRYRFRCRRRYRCGNCDGTTNNTGGVGGETSGQLSERRQFQVQEKGGAGARTGAGWKEKLGAGKSHDVPSH